MLTTTFSGRVVSFTSEPLYEQQPGEQKDGSEGRMSKGSQQRGNRIRSIRNELDELRKKVEQKRAKMAMVAGGNNNGDGNANVIGMDKTFNVMSSFKLDATDASYILSLQTPAPLSLVMLQSELDIDLVDVPGQVFFKLILFLLWGRGGLVGGFDQSQNTGLDENYHAHSLSLTHSLTHSLIHSLIHSLTLSFIHSFTHSLTHSLTHSPCTQPKPHTPRRPGCNHVEIAS